MIERDVFDALRTRAKDFRYSSFEYLEYEHAAAYTLLEDSKELILLPGKKEAAGVDEAQWAADEPDRLLRRIRDRGRETLVPFVPEPWKELFLQSGFSEFGILREYWISPLKADWRPQFLCAPIRPDECGEAAAITRACRLQSREFYGETAGSLTAWMTGNDPDAAAGGAKYETVLACRENGGIVGIICTAVYGFDGERGPVAWVREVAVLPAYQGRGYGRALIESALRYGAERGARNAFLMADDCNRSAIALYTKIGFEPNMDEAQIDLIYSPDGAQGKAGQA